jgi:hypothetical protein
MTPGKHTATPATDRFVLAFLKPSATERFEDFAELFHEETHHFAPGKSVPDVLNYTESMERRRELFDAWFEQKRAEAYAAAKEQTR